MTGRHAQQRPQVMKAQSSVKSPSKPGDHAALVAVFASVAAVGIVWGSLIPLLTVLMERDGVSSTLIGLNSAMPVLAVFVTSRLMPFIARRIGLNPALFGGLAVIAVCVLALFFFRSYGAWLALRFLIGLAAAVHWILSEAWINTLAPPERRGFYVGIYGMLILGGFALGPIVLTLIPIDGILPFALIAVSVVLSAIPIYIFRHHLPRLDDRPQHGSLAPMYVAPVTFLAALVSGLADGALWTLITVYGIDKGMSETGALQLLAALNVGTVLLQVPIGWLADRYGAVRLLVVCGVIGLAGALLLPIAMAGQSVLALWALAFVWGAFLASLYTIGLVELGHRFEGAALAEANGLFVSGYSLGSFVGPLAGGVAMDQSGPDALPAAVALVCALFLVFALVHGRFYRARG